MEESESERKKREEVQRRMQKLMPDLARKMTEIARVKVPIIDFSKIYTPPYQDMLAGLRLNLPKAEVPVLDVSALMPKFDIPQLKLDYATLFPDLAALHAQSWKAIIPSFELIQDLQRNQFAEILAKAQEAMRASLPPNWRDSEIAIPRDLEAMLLDEGLALAWVPSTPILKRLFSATTKSQRRRIIGERWQAITRDCIHELESIEDPKLKEHVGFAFNAATTLLANNPRPAQALSANLLDTILRQSFGETERKAITGQKTRMNIDDYPVRVSIVLGGIWGSFGEFWPSDDGKVKVPRSFTRHGSAHGVSSRQYSRINSVLALMHVVALLKLLASSDLA